jgi:Ca2+-transporting ATPase
MIESTQCNWHEISGQEAVRMLGSDGAHGLADAEVEARVRQFGRNEMTARKPMSEWKRFLLQFAQPLMYILLIASGVTFALGEYVDSAVIFGVTVVNAIVGFLQESKAEKAIEALSKMVLTETTVRRGGQRRRVTSVGLVPGDIVLLQSGDKVPADMRLLQVRNLQVDESALTGGARCSTASRSRRGPEGPSISQSLPLGKDSSGRVSENIS